MVLSYNIIERAIFTFMSIFGAGNVIWNCSQPSGLLEDLFLGHKNEFSLFINEVFNQPGASDSINLRPFSSYPSHKYLYAFDYYSDYSGD
jgi:hypothetical protein